MIKKLSYALAFCALTTTAIIITSCGKDDEPTPIPATKTPQELIVGKWKSAFHGEDGNSNSIWDASEREAVPADEIEYAIFNTDGTYNVTGEDTFTGTYKLINDNKSLAFQIPGEESDTLIIDKLDAITFITRMYDGPTHIYFTEMTKVD